MRWPTRVVVLALVSAHSAHAGDAAALDQALKDNNPAVRARAVEQRAQLAMRAAKPCPLGVIEALLDPDAKVREAALNWSGAFPPGRYPQEAAPVLLRCLQSEHASVRSLGAILLAELPKHDAATVKAVRALTHDKVTVVRNDAHNALFRMTGKLDDWLPYALQFLLERRDERRIGTDRLPSNEQAARNLITLGVAFRLRELAEERTDDLTQYLIESLAKGDAKMQRAVALYLADYFREPEGLLGVANPKWTWESMIPVKSGTGKGARTLSPVDPGYAEARKEQAEASRKKQAVFRQRLREAGLAQRLQQLRDSHAGGLVRGAAAQALQQMEKHEKREKTP